MKFRKLIPLLLALLLCMPLCLTAAVQEADAAVLNEYTETAALSAPTIRRIYNGVDGITLEWSATSNAESYLVLCRKNSNGWQQAVKLPAEGCTSWTDTSVTNGARYSYYVVSCSGNSRSAASATKSLIRLTRPTISHISCISDGVRVTWCRNTGATGIRIYRSTNGGDMVLVQTVTDGSLTWTDTAAVENGSSYQYKLVYFKNTASGSDSSAGRTATVCYLHQCTLSLKNFSNGVNLSWGYNTCADGYRISRSTDGNSFSTVKTVTGYSAVSWTDTSAVKGKTYYYKVTPFRTSESGSRFGVCSATQKITYRSTRVFSITAQPQNRTAAVGQSVSFTVSAVGTGLTYQWQQYDFTNDRWKTAAGLGAATATLSVSMTSGKDGNLYRCIVTNYAGKTRTSLAAALTLKSKHSAISDYTFAVCGASYDAGLTYQPLNDGSYTGHTDFSACWCSVLARRSGTTTIRMSKVGATTRTWLTDSRCLKTMLNSEPQDLYILTLGGNDSARLGMDYLGSIEDIHEDYHDNPDTFYGNYARIIERIQAHAPDAKIVMVTPASPQQDSVREAYQTAIRNIAGNYGLPFIDWEEASFMTSTYYSDEGQINKHPTTAAYADMALAFEKLFNTCVKEYSDYFSS